MMDRDMDPIDLGDGEGANDFDAIEGRIVGQSDKAYKVIKSDLTTFWVPKSVSQEDGTGGLVVQNWFIEKEGLDQ